MPSRSSLAVGWPASALRAARGLALTASLALAPAVTAAQERDYERDRGREAQAAEEPNRPEYRRRSLPTDTFKPSEDISEDFAVPFPSDI